MSHADQELITFMVAILGLLHGPVTTRIARFIRGLFK